MRSYQASKATGDMHVIHCSAEHAQRHCRHEDTWATPRKADAFPGHMQEAVNQIPITDEDSVYGERFVGCLCDGDGRRQTQRLCN